MKIYQIACNKTATVIVAKDETGSVFDLTLTADSVNNISFKSVEVLRKNAKHHTNFFNLNDTALVYDEIAAKVMDEFIEYAGDLHKLQVDELGELTLVNILEDCNPLNKAASTIDSKSWEESVKLNNIIFHKNRVHSLSSLFKIPDFNYLPILTFSDASTERHVQEHDFFKAYHSAGLSGLEFKLLWSEDN